MYKFMNFCYLMNKTKDLTQIKLILGHTYKEFDGCYGSVKDNGQKLTHQNFHRE